MHHYKNLTKPVEELVSVTCDVCGAECKTDYGINAIQIEKSWGFGSKKDMEKWEADVCENCVDKLLAPIIPFRKLREHW